VKFHRPQDTVAEDRVATALSKAYGWRLARGKFGCVYDFLAYYGRPERVVGVVEIKRRSMTWGDHDTIHVSMRKLTECCAVSESFGVPTFFVVECNSGIYVAPIVFPMLAHFPRKVGGRPPRLGAMNDQEWLFDLKLSLFKRV
jgi:hypothetical protein